MLSVAGTVRCCNAQEQGERRQSASIIRLESAASALQPALKWHVV